MKKIKVAFIAFDCVRLGFMEGIYNLVEKSPDHEAKCFTHFDDPTHRIPNTKLKWMDWKLDKLYAFSPDYVVMFNGFAQQTLPVTRFIRGLAESSSSPVKKVFHVEQGWLPQKGNIYMDDKGIGTSSSIAFDTKAANSIPDAFDWGAKIADLKAKYKAVPKGDPSISHLPKDYILIPMQLEKDTSIIYDSPNFKTMKAVVDYVKMCFPGKNIVVKTHPKDKTLDLRYIDGHNVHIEKDISINQLAAHSKAIIGVNSTSLIEGLIHYKPVHCLGYNVATSIYRGSVFFTGEIPAGRVLMPDEIKGLLDFKPDEQSVNKVLYHLLRKQFSRANPPVEVLNHFK